MAPDPPSGSAADDGGARAAPEKLRVAVNVSGSAAKTIIIEAAPLPKKQSPAGCGLVV